MRTILTQNMKTTSKSTKQTLGARQGRASQRIYTHSNTEEGKATHEVGHGESIEDAEALVDDLIRKLGQNEHPALEDTVRLIEGIAAKGAIYRSFNRRIREGAEESNLLVCWLAAFIEVFQPLVNPNKEEGKCKRR